VPVQAVIAATTDGGTTWTAEPLPVAPESSLQYAGAYPLYCVSDSNCRAVGILELTQAASKLGMPFVQQDVMLTLEPAGNSSVGSTTPTISG
jgi:hypothetical protein